LRGAENLQGSLETNKPYRSDSRNQITGEDP
jgi:hypothetical protein